ncbi:MAG: GTP-binding protein [Xanthomonadales bacterium]|nr:GTP-binding protein [Xanthomonadales bacterium]
MNEVSRKICMLGNFAVGKSSLVRRFVTGVFDASYQTTVGVKIDTCEVTIDAASSQDNSSTEATKVKMVLWDLAGEAELGPQSQMYIQGMQGYLLVADGSRMDTVHNAVHIQQQVVRSLGPRPFIMLLNKHDLSEQWQVPDSWIQQQRDLGWNILCTSALSGEAVPEAFDRLARAMIAPTAMEMLG